MKTSIFDKLNLRPQERRLVVIVGMVLFVLINWWFVWPFFGEWGKVFPDPAMTLAAVDRLVHHSTIFEMNVDSTQAAAVPSARLGTISFNPCTRIALRTEDGRSPSAMRIPISRVRCETEYAITP